jgi:hypothetical protein
VTNICASGGSCAFLTGDLNAVMQRSTDGGKTWSAIIPISPGFPASGGDLAPLVVEPSGRVDVVYQGYQITNTTTYTMNPAVSYFTSSSDRGSTWSTPVAVGAAVGTMSLSEWWIDDDIGIDSGGNLYATWDTQGTNADGSANDIGWLSFSTNHGRSWSAPVQAPADQSNVPHIMAVVGGAAGTAYVSWLSSSDPRGYALYLRAFSTKSGWLSGRNKCRPSSVILPSGLATRQGFRCSRRASSSSAGEARRRRAARSRTSSSRTSGLARTETDTDGRRLPCRR